MKNSHESEKTLEAVRKIVKKAALENSEGLKILRIIVTLKEDEYGGNYYDVKVIFDGKEARPKPGFKIDLRRAARRALEEAGIELFPVLWVIPDSEYKALKTEAA